jgi:hypothetical protein
MLIESGIFRRDERMYKVFRQTFNGNNEPPFIPEAADYLPVFTQDFGDTRGTVFFERPDVRKVAGPQVPEDPCGTQAQKNRNGKKP